jgi:hypothetical protein
MAFAVPILIGVIILGLVQDGASETSGTLAAAAIGCVIGLAALRAFLRRARRDDQDSN